MKPVIGVFCFIVVVFLNPIESMLGFNKEDNRSQITSAMSVRPPKLSARFYFSAYYGSAHAIKSINHGFVRVGIMEEEGAVYVIGYIEEVIRGKRNLCPFVHAVPEFGFNTRRIKIRVDGEYAYKYIPLPEKDALDAIFYKPYNPDLIRIFDIDYPILSKPLKPVFPVKATKPVSPGQTSSTQALNSGGQASPATGRREDS